MIQSVEKIYYTINGNLVFQNKYKLIETNGKIWIVPHNEENGHYQEILEWVENGGVIVDNGA